jgi:hypothetical protein
VRQRDLFMVLAATAGLRLQGPQHAPECARTHFGCAGQRRDQLLAISNRELDEVADDKVAMDQKQRDIALAQIGADMLAIERNEVACIWAAEARNNEIIDFRRDTTPMAAIGVRLVTVPRADPPPTSPEHGYDIVGGGRR